jgi:phosphoglycolate phosphatase/pyrophosphatase PpaX
MKYKCLILDHDDTAVKSTPDIHYPSFVEALKSLRPEKDISLADFVTYCFNPGFSKLCKDIMKFSESRNINIRYGRLTPMKILRIFIPDSLN